LIALGLILCVFASCVPGGDPEDIPERLDVSNTVAPVFSVPIVAIPSVSENAARLPEAQFHMIGFGQDLDIPAKSPRLSPALEYYTRDALAQVKAPCRLILTRIMDNEEGVGDLELEFRPADDSAYFIYLDHVRDLTVEEGETVEAGETLGLAGVAPEYRVELQVNFVRRVDEATLSTTHYCPLDYGTAAFIEAHEAFAVLEEWKLADEITGGTWQDGQ